MTVLLSSGEQRALIAEPEKVLLDLIYLTPGGDSNNCILPLRLQNLEQRDQDVHEDAADEFEKPKLSRAVKQVESLFREASAEEQRRCKKFWRG